MSFNSYATRVRSIINEASKNLTTKEILKLKKQIAHWKEQAGKRPEEEDLEDVSQDRASTQDRGAAPAAATQERSPKTPIPKTPE